MGFMSSGNGDPEEIEARQQVLGLMEDRALAGLHEATRAYCKRFPESVWGWLVSVPTLVDLGRFKEAKSAWRKAQKLAQPDAELDATLSYWASVIYKEQGRLKRAQRWINKALKSAPEEGAYWVTLGEILTKRGKRRAARVAYQTAVDLEGADVDEAHFNLALLLRGQRRYEDALQQVRKALEIDPDYAEAHALRHDLEAVLQGVGR